MELTAFCATHKNCPLELREALNFSDRDLRQAYRYMDGKSNFSAVILSTCNRTEIYLAHPEDSDPREIISGLLARFSALDGESVGGYSDWKTGEEAVEHLFRVAGGLESLVVGESEILGQVREAYRRADTAGAAGSLLGRLFENALQVGKKVRSEVFPPHFSRSIAGIAVERARDMLDRLEEKKVVLIGAGEVSELLCREIEEYSPAVYIVSTRRYQSALRLAEKYSGRAVKFNRLEEILLEADLVFSQTAAPHKILDLELLERVLSRRSGRRLYLFDLAVPRDLPRKVDRLPGAEVSNLEELVSGEFEADPEVQEVLRRAREEISAGCRQFDEYRRRRDFSETFRLLDDYLRKVKEEKIEELKNKFSAEELAELDKIIEQTINQTIHPLREVLPRLDSAPRKLKNIIDGLLDD